jgi:hypothetical protein
MTQKELEQAGREMLTLEILAEISTIKEEIRGYARQYGTLESLKATSEATGIEDFERDDACNAWSWALEYLAHLESRLKALRPDVAA